MAHQNPRVRTYTAGRLLAAAILLLAGAGSARADMVPIVDTIGADTPYNPGIAHTIGGGFPKGFAFSFGGEQAYALDTLELELAVNRLDGANQLTVALMTDVAEEPGIALASFSFDGRMSSSPAVLMATSDAPDGVLLLPGHYWLIASTPEGAEVAWWHSSPATAGLGKVLIGGSWLPLDDSTQSAFRLSAPAPVPVPGAALLGVVGLGYSGWRLRRRAR